MNLYVCVWLFVERRSCALQLLQKSFERSRSSFNWKYFTFTLMFLCVYFVVRCCLPHSYTCERNFSYRFQPVDVAIRLLSKFVCAIKSFHFALRNDQLATISSSLPFFTLLHRRWLRCRLFRTNSNIFSVKFICSLGKEESLNDRILNACARFSFRF